MNTKTISDRSFRMLVKKVGVMESMEQLAEAPSEALQALRAKMLTYGVPCDGEAHSNAFIDNCMCCLNYRWGLVPNRELVSK